jgi:hypothetical protein
MLLKDPLIHFLAVGALLFAFFAWRGETGPDEIVIDRERVAELEQSARLLRGRPLTRAELVDVVEPAIREEVYYREALALGLDVNDDEVRRRLVEKMQYLTQDLADPEPASEEELERFFSSRPDLFRIPELVTFDQVFFSPSQRGESLEADVAAAREALVQGAEPATVGDRTPLDERYVGAPRERIEVLFGPELTEAVFTMEPGGWAGPYESDFGLHLIRLAERTAARQPTFAEARERAAEQFAEERRRAANEAAYAEIRERYDVTVEWPAADGSTQ